MVKVDESGALERLTYRPNEAAKVLGIGRSRVYELIAAGDLEAVKLGQSTLIPRDSLVALVESLRSR